MNRTIIELPEDLPPELVMALIEVLNNLSDALWQQHETSLVELHTQATDSQLTFDFENDLPF
jgi:hypothetical protein